MIVGQNLHKLKDLRSELVALKLFDIASANLKITAWGIYWSVYEPASRKRLLLRTKKQILRMTSLYETFIVFRSSPSLIAIIYQHMNSNLNGSQGLNSCSLFFKKQRSYVFHPRFLRTLKTFSSSHIFAFSSSTFLSFSLQCHPPCLKPKLPNRPTHSFFPTLCLIANFRSLIMSMVTKSPRRLPIGWTPTVQI